MEFHLGQRVIWFDSGKRGTVVEVVPADDGYGPWLRVEPDEPDEGRGETSWEDQGTVRPLDPLERLSEA